MAKQPTSKGRIRQLNPRQCKKLRLGGFQEFVFTVKARFHSPLDQPAFALLIDHFIDFLWMRDLMAGGMGGALPLAAAEGIVQPMGRGSTTEDDRQAVLEWLRNRAEVASASVSELVDGWYGWRQL